MSKVENFMHNEFLDVVPTSPCDALSMFWLEMKFLFVCVHLEILHAWWDASVELLFPKGV